MGNILETKYAGFKLSSPIIVASSGLTNSVDKIKELEKAGAGAVVLKSLFEEQIEMQSAWMMEGSDFPEMKSFIHDYVQCNHISDYLTLIQEAKEHCRFPVIASINCYKVDAWIDFARQIEVAGADALELNIFNLNTSLGNDCNSTAKECVEIVRRVREAIQIPVIPKIGKYYGNIVALVDALYSAGAAAVILFNRMYQPDIDINKLQMVSGQVFSSHSDIADTLRWVGIVSGKLPHVPIIASTGIYDWEDVIKCILAGSPAVEVCSTVYQHGNEIISQMNRSIEEWMTSVNCFSIESFRGKLSYTSAEEVSLFERVQFMKYFSNRD